MVSRGIILSIDIGLRIFGVDPSNASPETVALSVLSKGGDHDDIVLWYLVRFGHWAGAYFLEIAQFGFDLELRLYIAAMLLHIRSKKVKLIFPVVC